MPRGGPRAGAGRKPNAVTIALREIIANPKAIENAFKFAETNAVFWLQLVQQVHGRPYQQIGARVETVERHEVRLPSGDPVPTCAADIPTFGPN